MKPLAILLLSALTCLGQLVPSSPSVTLAWDDSPSTNVVNYFVYVGPQSGAYSTKLLAGLTNRFTVGSIKPGATYFFAVTATDDPSQLGGLPVQSDRESVFSNEVSYTSPTNPPPLPPTNLVVLTIQSNSLDAASIGWKDIGFGTIVPMTISNQVFRLKIAAAPVPSAVTNSTPSVRPASVLPPVPKLASPKSK